MTRSAARRSGRLRVSVTDARGRRITQGAALGLGRWLVGAAPRSACGTLVVAIVSDTVMRQLNRRFRGKNRPTDVLSFPGPPPVLGDIAIARGVAGRQARALGHSQRTELRILALHGLLHLLGYDHEADRGEMGQVEERLRKRAKLPVGLIARS